MKYQVKFHGIHNLFFCYSNYVKCVLKNVKLFVSWSETKLCKNIFKVIQNVLIFLIQINKKQNMHYAE